MPLVRNSRVLIFSLTTAGLMVVAMVALPISKAQQGLFHSPPQDGQLVPSPQRSGHVPTTVEVLSSIPEGVDLDSYLKNAYSSVTRNLVVKLPTANDQKESVVAIRVRIPKDGSLTPEGSVVIVSSSGTKTMETAARNAIRSAAPFGPLPKTFTAHSLDLLFTFHFTGGTSEPKPETKTVPAATT
jgi:TonB family protein